jgi:hypothetical protein
VTGTRCHRAPHPPTRWWPCVGGGDSTSRLWGFKSERNLHTNHTPAARRRHVIARWNLRSSRCYTARRRRRGTARRRRRDLRAARLTGASRPWLHPTPRRSGAAYREAGALGCNCVIEPQSLATAIRSVPQLTTTTSRLKRSPIQCSGRVA